MNKFNYKSRKGFTLIELLVVIGILAVLAAIAIPSVAGLIDRANVSADNTNANEMTNAMERFVSEYELYKQDIASGAIKDGDSDGVPDNMDAAQNRVYNVTKAVTRADIEKLESATGLNGVRIDIGNKYAQNSKTAKAVMQNYMKTNSSTFEPKQSDMTYWYHTITGYTVVAEKDIDTSTLYNLLPVEVRYGNAQPTSLTDWIDLSSNAIIPDITITKAEKYVSPKDGKLGITFHTILENPKYNENINLNKVYVLAVNEKTSTILTMNTATSKRTFWDAMGVGLQERYQNSTDAIITPNFPFTILSGNTSENCLFRLAYEYEENGQIRYVYSATFRYSYDTATN